MKREIVLYGDPVLRRKAQPVEEVTPELQQLAEDMLETMYEASGIGLAAPQIGEAIQLAIVDINFESEEPLLSYLRIDGQDVELSECMPLIFINPQLKPKGEKQGMEEGCLSMPDLRSEVIRSSELVADLELLDGKKIRLETDGLLARAIQHEVDHLNGVLFIDRLSSAVKLRAKRELKKLQQEWV